MQIFTAVSTAKNETGVFLYYEYTDLTDETVFEEYIDQVRAAASNSILTLKVSFE